jgi:hypothetical protein
VHEQNNSKKVSVVLSNLKVGLPTLENESRPSTTPRSATDHPSALSYREHEKSNQTKGPSNGSLGARRPIENLETVADGEVEIHDHVAHIDGIMESDIPWSMLIAIPDGWKM